MAGALRSPLGKWLNGAKCDPWVSVARPTPLDELQGIDATLANFAFVNVRGWTAKLYSQFPLGHIRFLAPLTKEPTQAPVRQSMQAT